MRINSVEKELIGQHVSKLKIDELISALRSSINIVADYRVSKEYRKHLLGVMLKRMLQKLQEETQ
jgi:CO/xanthine dehydrogenase FAD-binding subunit